MLARRPFAAIATAAFALVLLLPAIALAADGPNVTGSVATADGTPLDRVEITVTIAGTNDMVWSATSDATGAWGVAVGVQLGQTLHIAASRVDFSTPEPNGCLPTGGFMGSVDVTVDALPLAPVVMTLEPAPSGEICSATGTPRVGPTLPPTDAGMSTKPGAGATLVPVVVGLATIVVFAVGPARRPARRR